MSLATLKTKSFASIITCLLALLYITATPAQSQSIEPFIGMFEGSADFDENDKVIHRDMSAEILKTDAGFTISWTSGTYKPDGRIKEKSYTIEFVPSERDGIFASAMQRNVFGKQVPLNPLKGEPFVWSKLVDDTLTVFSLFIDEVGDYELQEYHRTLTEGGLNLEFRRFRNGEQIRTITTLLKRQ